MIISCEDPGKIGLNLDEDNGVVQTHYQEVVLPTSIVQFDPRTTFRSPSIQVGGYTDPNFGAVVSKFYSQLSLTSFKPTMDSLAVYDAFVMEIGFQDIYGDTPFNFDTRTVDIYQLSEGIDTLASYNRLSEIATKPAPLGTWTFEPMVFDTLRTDSTHVVILDDAVGLDLFTRLKAGDPIFDSNAAFNEYFKGIALIGGPGPKNIFNINSLAFRFILKYHEFNADGDEVDRTYTFSSGSYRFFHLDSDKTGTPLAGLAPDNMDFTPADDYLYAQLGVLMALKIDFNVFYQITDTLENMIINKAEIVIGDLMPFDEYKKPYSVMQAYFTGIDNKWPIKTADGTQFVALQKEGVPPGLYGIVQNVELVTDTTITSTAEYSIAMSAFLQNLQVGNFDDTESGLEKEATILFYPQTDIIFPQQLPGYIAPHQFIVHKDSIKLKIHYTVPASSPGNN